MNYKDTIKEIQATANSIPYNVRSLSEYQNERCKIFQTVVNFNLTECVDYMLGQLIVQVLKKDITPKFLAYYDLYNQFSAELAGELMYNDDEEYNKYIDEMAEYYKEQEEYENNLR